MATPQQSEQPRSAPALSAKRAAPSPLPQLKSAVADFGHFVEWPNPRYSEVRLGRGRGWGSMNGALPCRNLPTLPQPKSRIRGFRPINRVIEIGNSRFRLGGGSRSAAALPFVAKCARTVL